MFVKSAIFLSVLSLYLAND